MRLDYLRRKYKIDSYVSTHNNDFDQLTAIANWVNSQWPHGTSGKFDPTYFDADVILIQARHGARFWCHVSAMTFIQIASSMGYQGRLVSLSKKGYIPEHAVAEFWSNAYQKWVMIDPDFNIWYTKAGIPLNVLELHNVLMNNEIDSITIVRGKNRPINELEGRVQTLILYYNYFYVDMRNDWLTNHYFAGHPARSDSSSLLWKDKRLAPILHFKPEVSEPNALYWDMNRTHMSFSDGFPVKGSISVYLDTNTPNFSHFIISTDNSKPVSINSNQFQWTIHEGANSLAVRSINSFNQNGIPSDIMLIIGNE
jgi:hypothetical protein